MIKCGYCDHFMTPARSRNKYGDYYYYINCVNEYCETRKKNSRLKRAIRGKIIVDYIINILSRKLDITEQVYNDCVKDYSSTRGNQLELMGGSMHAIKEGISNLKTSINELSLSISSSTPKAVESLRNQIRSKSEELANKEAELEQLEDQKITLDAQVNAKIIPYKNFLNFFENAEQEVKSNTDTYLLDQLIRNIFLNFSVKNGKVLSHELKEPFATYQKLGVFNMGWRISILLNIFIISILMLSTL